MEGVHDVLRGDGYAGGVRLLAQSQHLGLHLRGAAAHSLETNIQLDIQTYIQKNIVSDTG